MREQRVDVLRGVIVESDEHVGQVVHRILAVRFTARNERVQDRGVLTGLVVANE